MHGKWYFLKALHRDSFAALRSDIPHALLTGVKNVSGESNNNYVLDASKVDIADLAGTLSQVRDPRARQGMIYPFVPLLSLCICAVVSGYTQYRQIADWIGKLPSEVRRKFGLRGDRVPDETTISIFIRKIEPQQLLDALQGWLLKTYKKDVDFTELSIDGKALRGTGGEPKEQKGFLNVFATELGIVIDHVPTMKGGGEKKAARDLIETGKLDVSGKIVLADALHTDRALVETLEKTVENKLHYRKDMVFGEDRSTIRAGHGPHNMASLRNFALGLLLASGIDNVKRCVDNLRHDSSWVFKMAA